MNVRNAFRATIKREHGLLIWLTASAKIAATGWGINLFATFHWQ
jgi:hypothetical protein